jgi:hypothetical protein
VTPPSPRAGEVEALLDASPHPQRPVIDAMRAIIARAVPDAVESVKWNAPSFATAEHFATFNLRAKTGVQLVLHRGARPTQTVDMRAVLGEDAQLLEWKGPDRAVLTVRDAAHLATLRMSLGRLVRDWATHVE